jgi:hypothetical protein
MLETISRAESIFGLAKPLSRIGECILEGRTVLSVRRLAVAESAVTSELFSAVIREEIRELLAGSLTITH